LVRCQLALGGGGGGRVGGMSHNKHVQNNVVVLMPLAMREEIWVLLPFAW
jgi:hypothetical protein